MRILICTYTTPGYAPNDLIKYLETTDHDFQVIACPAKHERRFIPGISHLMNIRQVGQEAKGDFDIAIAPDPAFMISLDVLRKAGRVGQAIYWRLDYFPRKYPPGLDWTYQWLERFACDHADTIWSISDPGLGHIAASLPIGRVPVEHVPYLVNELPMHSINYRDWAFWMGPDLDGSRPICKQAVEGEKVAYHYSDYNDDKARLTDQELVAALDRTAVGLAVYKPTRWAETTEAAKLKSSKYFCDSSRIRRFLAHGVPVVTTAVAPNYKVIEDFKAGYIVPTWDVDAIRQGVRYCLERVDELSQNAYRAAAEFTWPNWDSKYNILANACGREQRSDSPRGEPAIS